MKKTTPFGLKIKEIRKSQKKSVRELSELSGVSHSYISQIENGDRDVPKPELIKKLADGLSVDYYDLMRSAGYMDDEELKIEDVIRDVTPELKVNYLKTKSAKIGRGELLIDSFGDIFKEESDIGFIIFALRSYRRKSLDEIATKSEIDKADLTSIEYFQETPTTKQLIAIGEALDVPNLPIWIKDNFGIHLDITDSITMLKNSQTKIEVEIKDIEFKLSSDMQLTYKKIPKEILRKSLFSIDDLLKQDQYPVYFNKKILSTLEKDKIKQIIELLFRDVPFEEPYEDSYLKRLLEDVEKKETK